jgi:hypothetical protein
MRLNDLANFNSVVGDGYGRSYTDIIQAIYAMNKLSIIHIVRKRKSPTMKLGSIIEILSPRPGLERGTCTLTA